TDYYTSILMRRAGLLSADRYLEVLGSELSELAETPGRKLQSLAEASFDAWIKYYRPDEHSVNSAVSYYGKGAVAAMLLDLEIRRRSLGERSLDDVIRALWRRYGLPNIGIAEDGVEDLVTEVAGGNWHAFFDEVVRGRAELPYEDALGVVGLEIEWKADSGAQEVWLGLRTRSDNGRTKIAHVLADGPAWGTGISPGDELVALDGYRVDDSSLADRLRDYRVGDVATLTFFRRDELSEVRIPLAARPMSHATLKRVEHPTTDQRRIYEDWLRSPWP